MLEKVSWTCERCGLWSSMPEDSHLQGEFATYDGLKVAEAALKGLAEMLRWRISGELRVQIVSEPVKGKPSWLTARQQAAADLRMMMLLPVSGQEFVPVCRRCGFVNAAHKPE